MAMDPRPHNVLALVLSALLVVVALWLIVRIGEVIWLPLLIIALVVMAIVIASWLLYRRTRRW